MKQIYNICMSKGGRRAGSGRKNINGESIKVKLPYELIDAINNNVEGNTLSDKIRNQLNKVIHSKSKLKVIDLFCGIGGFSYGFKKTGKFDVVLGADIWDVALNTFKSNHGDTKLLKCDIRDVEKDFWNQYINKVDVIIAGPPCQGFSMSGKRDKCDKRNTLFNEVVRVTSIINPKYVVLENVVGLLSMTDQNGNNIKDLIVNSFNNIGYKVDYKILNAASYGVPQERKRVIFLISKDYPLVFPEPYLTSDKFVTVGDALGNVDPNGDIYFEAKTPFQKKMKGRSKIQNHERRLSSELVTKRMSYIPQGGNWKDIPKRLGTGGGIHSNAYKRLDPNKPSITIKHAAKAMIIHPTQNRILTVRECARLQSFDDDFILSGNVSEQHQQLANAVPPLLGEAIAKQVFNNINSKKSSLKFIDLFCGIGGFRIAFEKLNCKCVFSCDNDKYASKTYEDNFGESPLCDIKKIEPKTIPDHDILCAGFPCQPFSIAGKRLGFKDTRGTLFFDVSRIIKEKQPKIVFLENVSGLVNHDNGKTLNVILNVLKELNYSCYWSVMNAKDFGVPQSRNRWYCVAVKKGCTNKLFSFPKKVKDNNISFHKLINLNLNVKTKYQITKQCEKNIWKNIDKKSIKVMPYTLAYDIRPSRCQFVNSKICCCLTAKMGTGGSNVPVLISKKRRLTEKECLKIMGFPANYKISEGPNTYKQIGNSVAVPVIELIAKEIIKILKN